MIEAKEKFMEIPFIDLRVEEDFNERIFDRWKKALYQKDFIGGPALKELTTNILNYTGAKYFIPCANGTDALQVALRAVNIGKNDNVLIPDFTFWATYEAVINVGANPIIIDIDPYDFQMDFELCCKAIEKYKPKAIILVHLYGWCSQKLDEFRAICKQKNIFLIEDGAQIMGSKFKDEDIFKSAKLATVSFYPAKVLGCAGDGGGIFTDSEELYNICISLCNHGRATHYGHSLCGWNSRMDEVQAHFLIESLKEFPIRLESRKITEKKYLEFYEKNKTNLKISIEKPPLNITSNAYLQVSLAKENYDYKSISTKLLELGIKTANTYPCPVSKQQGLDKSVEIISEDNVAEHISKKIVNLPLFPYMTDEEINYICESLLKI